ncbi:hypothetical protein ACFL27_11060 [candidate division CSSED10-310 bacterium]|uniref:Uncharacterized protein n=1 Tax=candidate division CSSED10-310 bacterium TaxID=2855610 RepID=A0ABV6YWZ2_UNCC1
MFLCKLQLQLSNSKFIGAAGCEHFVGLQKIIVRLELPGVHHGTHHLCSLYSLYSQRFGTVGTEIESREKAKKEAQDDKERARIASLLRVILLCRKK